MAKSEKKGNEEIAANGGIKTDFHVVVKGYLKQSNQKKREINRQKFVDNIFNSDYILCLRGTGNYSFRFYETLSAGRIPVFVNTDSVLPLDDIIDWKKYCVWVEENEIERIDQILLDFHNSLNNVEFTEMQVKIRNLWFEWIQDKAFLNKFHLHLQRYLSGEAVDIKI